jgi:hypothetical protein
MPKTARALLAAVFLLGCAPALTIVTDAPAATATPLWTHDAPRPQEPSPPQLSDEEQKALDAKKSGTLKPSQKDALKRAERKQNTAEKYEGERNQQKRDNNNRKGGRKR